MANLNKGEFGQVIRANIGQDVSAATGYTFILEPKIGEKLTRIDADGVALGITDVTVGAETFTANQYINYTIQDGDLDFAGLWRKKGQATMSNTQEIIGDYEEFTVLA